MPKNATHKRKCGYHTLFMEPLHLFSTAGRGQSQLTKQVNIMAIIITIYSSVLALAVWQEKQHAS